MAEFSPKLPQASRHEAIPFWRDVRVLGVLAQIGFVILILLAAAWLFNNVSQNMDALGAFRCADGSSSFRCGFNFLKIDAQFDIAEKLTAYDPSDSYGRALFVGALNTFQITVLGVVLATLLGVLAGIARLSTNWLISNIAKWYVDIMRNTPLLLQLFFLFFGVILTFPQIKDAAQLMGLPIYLSQRGINMPWFVFMPSFTVWLAFLVLGLVQAQILWVILGRIEERTGKSRNRLLWSLVSFVLVAWIGWSVSSANADDQAILVPQSLRIRELSDMQDAVMRQLREVNDAAEIETAVAEGRLTQEQVDAAAYTVCAVKDSPSTENLSAQLRALYIPFTIELSDRVEQAGAAYIAGDCQILVASKAILAGERDLLENSAEHLIIPVQETPLRLSIPRIEGLNFVGGIKLSPNFAAILIGLVLYIGAFIAEIVRAGIQSVPKGQSEAARALGLTESQRLQLVVLPQALRVIIPPLTSQYLNLAKNSSLAIAVGFPDLWSTAFTTLNQSGQSVQVFLIVMGAYLSLSLSISFLLNWYNQRISLVER
jgi:general L-amino acid transport system permease protein